MKHFRGKRICFGECLLLPQTNWSSLSLNNFWTWFAWPSRPSRWSHSTYFVGSIHFDIHDRTTFRTETFYWFTKVLWQSNLSVVSFWCFCGSWTTQIEGVALLLVFWEAPISQPKKGPHRIHHGHYLHCLSKFQIIVFMNVCFHKIGRGC